MVNTTYPTLKSIGAALSLAGLALSSSSFANEAVSAINGKLDAAYGSVNDTYSRGLSGSISVPIAESWGFQFDSLYTHAAEDDFYGFGGHFFTRKPDIGLLGLYVGGLHGASSMDNISVAAEGEYYFDKVTVGGVVGYDNVQNNGLDVTYSRRVNTQDDFVVANIYAAIYPIDNLMIRASYTNRIRRNFYNLDVEYQTPVKGLAVFGDIGWGDNGFFQLLGGVRYYIGKDKALKLRHRQDDPTNFLGSTQSVIQTGGQNSNQPQSPQLRRKWCKS